jgi:hypothetical protein
MPSAAADLPSAESEHASGGVRAAPLLTIGPKRKSAALSADFSNVAPAATPGLLLLRAPKYRKEKCVHLRTGALVAGGSWAGSPATLDG